MEKTIPESYCVINSLQYISKILKILSLVTTKRIRIYSGFNALKFRKILFIFIIKYISWKITFNYWDSCIFIWRPIRQNINYWIFLLLIIKDSSISIEEYPSSPISIPNKSLLHMLCINILIFSLTNEKILHIVWLVGDSNPYCLENSLVF